MEMVSSWFTKYIGGFKNLSYRERLYFVAIECRNFRLKSDLTLMYRTVYGHCGLKFASFLHCLITQLMDIVLRYRNSTVVSIVVRLVLLIAALTLGIVLIMTLGYMRIVCSGF